MKELGFKESFALIAINGMDPDRMTTAKRIALRSIIAAEKLEKFLNTESNLSDLEHELKSIPRLSDKALKKAEKELVTELTKNDLLEKVPNLLCCDMLYVTGDISIFEYCSDEKEYSHLMEYFRAELLEDGKVSDEIVCLWWLFKESSCFYDFFSKDERQKVSLRLTEIYMSSKLAKKLFSISIQRLSSISAYKYLKKKKDIFSTKIANGFLFVFPFVERYEAIFIDMEKWFSNSEQRLDAVLNRLITRGQKVTVVARGSGPILKIRNVYYECVPATVYCKYPIQGIRLRRYILTLS